jgi:hypothetical protein
MDGQLDKHINFHIKATFMGRSWIRAEKSSETPHIYGLRSAPFSYTSVYFLVYFIDLWHVEWEAFNSQD